jgi:catechol 2,3-dioxygenase-like lactoylglutathione lyase family enzyme
MPITRMDHFTVLTTDVEKTVGFYRDLLSFTPGPRPAFPSRVRGSIMATPQSYMLSNARPFPTAAAFWTTSRFGERTCTLS